MRGASSSSTEAIGTLPLLECRSLLDPGRSFVETVFGEICVDLGRYGEESGPARRAALMPPLSRPRLHNGPGVH